LSLTLGSVLIAAAGEVRAGDNGGHHAHGAQTMAAQATPTLPGQDAFGAMQEVLALLESDPNTDWSRVDIAALREHLVDMNDVTLRSRVIAKPVAAGARFEITGEGRTQAAIQRMVPAHAREMHGRGGWTAATQPLPDGVALTVTSTDPQQLARIRALGFFGFMARGSHHQPHHLAIARGERVH
jgi:hypothetical protein